MREAKGFLLVYWHCHRPDRPPGRSSTRHHDCTRRMTSCCTARARLTKYSDSVGRPQERSGRRPSGPQALWRREALAAMELPWGGDPRRALPCRRQCFVVTQAVSSTCRSSCELTTRHVFLIWFARSTSRTASRSVVFLKRRRFRRRRFTARFVVTRPVSTTCRFSFMNGQAGAQIHFNQARPLV